MASSEARTQLLSPVWPHFTDIIVDYAKGSYIYDINGTRYLDLTSGIGVTNTGHCHPRIVAAIERQAKKLLHGQLTIVLHEPILELVEELQTVTPEPLNCYFFTNSGTEAVESALKLARHATGKTNIIAFQGGYHGRTVGAMSITTAKTVYRRNYQPLMPGVIVSPFPYVYRYSEDEDTVTNHCLSELEHILNTQSAPEETAAMIIEPVLGEGGYVVPPVPFIQGLREICDRHGILLIFDEVQTGFGRTGKFFAFEHFGVIPDILVMAKGLASGLPLSGIAANQDIMQRWITGSHGGTYGGNPLAAAAAVETIRVIKEEKLVDNARNMGIYLLNRLKVLKNDFPNLGDVRGLGLMIGCEFSDFHRNPDRELAQNIRKFCLNKNLILLTCGTHDHVIRWIPPLNVSIDQIDEALDIFSAALARFGGQQDA